MAPILSIAVRPVDLRVVIAHESLVHRQHRRPGLCLCEAVVCETTHDPEVAFDIVGPRLALGDLLTTDPQRLIRVQELLRPEYGTPIADHGVRHAAAAERLVDDDQHREQVLRRRQRAC